MRCLQPAEFLLQLRNLDCGLVQRCSPHRLQRGHLLSEAAQLTMEISAQIVQQLGEGFTKYVLELVDKSLALALVSLTLSRERNGDALIAPRIPVLPAPFRFLPAFLPPLSPLSPLAA